MASIALSSSESFGTAIAAASTVHLSSYILGEQTEALLEKAARRGAHVQVVLSGAYSGKAGDGIKQANARCIQRLKAAGVDAVLGGGQMVHLKAAVVDETLYFDDSNWTGKDELLIQDTKSEDTAAVDKLLQELMHGRTVKALPPGIALGKREALQLENALLNRAPTATIDIETETLGPSCITHSLAALAAQTKVRLLVANDVVRESTGARAELVRLEKAGVEVRLTASHEKFALAGTSAWVGSANASPSLPDTLDWGAQLDYPDAVAELEGRFEQHWQKAKSPV